MRIDGQTLSVADYPGNRFFNTIGNLELNRSPGSCSSIMFPANSCSWRYGRMWNGCRHPTPPPPAPEGRCISRCWRQSAPPGAFRCAGARRPEMRRSTPSAEGNRYMASRPSGQGIHRVATAVIAALLVQRFAIEGTGAPLPNRTALRFCHPSGVNPPWEAALGAPARYDGRGRCRSRPQRIAALPRSGIESHAGRRPKARVWRQGRDPIGGHPWRRALGPAGNRAQTARYIWIPSCPRNQSSTAAPATRPLARQAVSR